MNYSISVEEKYKNSDRMKSFTYSEPFLTTETGFNNLNIIENYQINNLYHLDHDQRKSVFSYDNIKKRQTVHTDINIKDKLEERINFDPSITDLLKKSSSVYINRVIDERRSLKEIITKDE